MIEQISINDAACCKHHVSIAIILYQFSNNSAGDVCPSFFQFTY